MTHREAIKEWLSSLELKNEHVVDWGSGSKPVSRYIKHEGCSFTTIDKNPLIATDRRSPNHIQADIQESMILDRRYHVAFCIEVLEHTLRPDKVLANIYDNLFPMGMLYLSMPYNFPIHSEDDYIRLTPNGLTAWLEKMGFRIVKFDYSVGDEGYLVEAQK